MIKELFHKRSNRESEKEKYLSVKYQLEWIAGLQEQVNWANNQQILTDFILRLEIFPRRQCMEMKAKNTDDNRDKI